MLNRYIWTAATVVLVAALNIASAAPAVPLRFDFGPGPLASYKANLKKHIALVRARGGVPVIVSPMERRAFDAEGRVKPSLSGLILPNRLSMIFKVSIRRIPIHWRPSFCRPVRRDLRNAPWAIERRKMR